MDATTLARCGNKTREWTDKRDAAICAAHAEGMSLRDIADAVGLSHTGVAKIVRRNST